MQQTDLPKVSIIVPTYNEEKDIRHTLDALTGLDYPHTEIIAIDDSTDRTPDIIREYAPHGVQLLRPTTREGRCGARNLGIQHSTGDIVVVLNADVLLPSDFLKRIVPHYLAGADYVLVESTVANPDSLYARFIDSEGKLDYGSSDMIEWTEAFSCRRAVILDVGLFPVGFPVPMAAGEDGFVGESLHARGYRKTIDRSIVVRHFAPSSFSEYWGQQVGRGKGFVQVRVFLKREPSPWVLMRTALKTLWVALWIAMVLTWLWRAWQISRHSPQRWRDWLPFLWIVLVQRGANSVGEYTALNEIWKANRIARKLDFHRA